MAKFEVSIFETKRYTVVVEARDEEDARERAYDLESTLRWEEDEDFFETEIDNVEEVEVKE